jgi:diguanylate cyclase (GGDEF)-like protein
MLLPFLPDLSTLRLCSLLLTVAFSVVFLVLWIGRREERYLRHWSASAALYGGVLLGLELLSFGSPGGEPPLAAVCLLLCLLVGSNLLLVSGLRLFDGLPPWCGWMLPVLALGLLAGAGPPLAGLLPGGLSGGLPALAAQRIAGTFGLLLSVLLVGLLLMRRPAPARPAVVAPTGHGRVIAGCAMLGFIPGYLIAMALEAGALDGRNYAALLPMLSDQLLLPVLYLGLLAMPGERARDALQAAALRDPLTGAWNRAGLAARQAGFLARGGALVLIDIDHFKAVNDRHGHAAGDALLAGFAGRVAGLAAEQGGALYRLGGDEFLLLLPGLAEAEAAALAQRLRAAATKGEPPCTISLGLAMVAAGEAALQPGLSRADGLLYRAKALGRDQLGR